MKKIIFVTPHLSTGGLPQYLCKKIQSFISEYEIWCIEYSNYSDEYVVQKNKIRELLGERLITLGEDKSELLNNIDSINPDIIHFEEVPEDFISTDILDRIYVNNRGYNILVTTHSSNTNPRNLRYLADKFILVSEWSCNVFKSTFGDSIPCEIWEYPIEIKSEIDKEIFKSKLGLEPGFIHILNVGLFTPGKNQIEIFRLARKLLNYKIKFHFVGNLAPNFQSYWEPLLKTKPENCIIHGERSDVEDFYSACDAFYFTSNLELNPIVLKEAISFRLPTFAKRLETYEDSYDGLVNWISGDLEIDKKTLIKKLQRKKESQLNYNSSNKLDNITRPIIFNFNNTRGPFLEIIKSKFSNHLVKFIDSSTNEVKYKFGIESGCWVLCNFRYFIDWKIEITTETGEVFTHKMDFKNSRVYVSIDSKSIGDTLAWFPYVDEFRKKLSCEVVCSTFHNNLFIDSYPQIEFVEPGTSVENINAQYNIGWYYTPLGKFDHYRNPKNFRTQPMQKTASDILGLDYKELRPRLNLVKKVRENIVSIAIHSTAQSKYWNNEGGWQQVVDYLNDLGYRVVLLSKEGDGYMGNFHPKGIEKIDEGPIENIIDILLRSKLFIGIGSGLSWLSWATETPTCIISGFSYDYTEPSLDVIRIKTPEGKCTGCFNTHRLDPGDWMWCPLHKGTDRQFECSKSITPGVVIEEISKYLK